MIQKEFKANHSENGGKHHLLAILQRSKIGFEALVSYGAVALELYQAAELVDESHNSSHNIVAVVLP